MTIASETNKAVYVGNGVTTVFAYNFLIFDASHMIPYLDGVKQTTGFTVDGVGNELGGNVTFAVAPDDQSDVSLVREVPLTQSIDYTPYDPFPAETHETGLDLGAMRDQQLQEQLNRVIKAPIGAEPGVDYTMPPFVAGKGIMWDDHGEKKMINSDDDLNGITTAAQGSADAAAGSASNASTSATNASNSEDKAQQWAEEPEDSEVESGKYSALHWAAKSEAFSMQAFAALDKSRWPTIKNDSVDVDHDIDFSAGSILDSTGTTVITVLSEITKQINATWAAGQGGGLFSGSVAANTTYHCFVIRRDSDGFYDAGFSSDLNASDIPSGHTAYRRIGSLLTDSSANILEFKQVGDWFRLKNRASELNITALPTARTAIPMTVPSDIELAVKFDAGISGSNAVSVLFTDGTSSQSSTPSAGNNDIHCASGTQSVSSNGTDRITNDSGEIYYRASSASSVNEFQVWTRGWIDQRLV